jgi:hypothetical protein
MKCNICGKEMNNTYSLPIQYKCFEDHSKLTKISTPSPSVRQDCEKCGFEMFMQNGNVFICHRCNLKIK